VFLRLLASEWELRLSFRWGSWEAVHGGTGAPTKHLFGLSRDARSTRLRALNPASPSSLAIGRREAVQKLTAVNPGAIHSSKKSAAGSGAEKRRPSGSSYWRTCLWGGCSKLMIYSEWWSGGGVVVGILSVSWVRGRWASVPIKSPDYWLAQLRGGRLSGARTILWDWWGHSAHSASS